MGGKEWKIRAILVGYLYRSILASLRMFWSSWPREGPLLLGNLRTCIWVEHGSQRALPASADSTEPPGQNDWYAKEAYGVACSEALQPLGPRTSVITVKGPVGTENVTHNLLRLINTGEGPLLSISHICCSLTAESREQCLAWVTRARMLLEKAAPSASGSWDLWPQNRPTSRFL